MGGKASKLRWKQRKAEKERAELERLRGLGFSCAKCDSYTGSQKGKGLCEFYSDFHGICTVQSDGLCVKFGERGGANA